MEGLDMTATAMTILQARARCRSIARKEIPNLLVVVEYEYEDDDYTYISSAYPYPVLKTDVEQIKRPMTILYGKRDQPL